MAARLAPESRHLAVARHCTVDTYLFAPETPPYLISPAKMVFPARVDAIAVVEGKQTDTLVVLAGGTLHFVQRQAPGLQVVHRAEVGHPTGPVTMVVVQAQTAYVVLHQCQGFVTVVDASCIIDKAERGGQQQQTTGGRKRQWKRARGAPTSRTYALGHISVISIVPLPNAPLSFAVLYRDVQFTYSLRLYAFSGLDSPLRVAHQMRDFHEAPLLAFAAAGGVVVASDLRCYYFPSPGVQAVVQTELEHVTRNSAGDVVTLDLLAAGSVVRARSRGKATLNSVTREPAALLGASFLSHAQISPSEHIIVSDMGHTLKVVLESSSSAAVATVGRFAVEDLGWSTVASSIVHLSHNVLFAASRLSRSVLLELVPCVSVLAFFQSSPPVLDFADGAAHTDDLVVVQGGFYAGELVVRSLQQYQAVCVLAGSVPADASGLRMDKGKGIAFFVSGPGWNQRGTVTPGASPKEDTIAFECLALPEGSQGDSEFQQASFGKALASGKIYLDDSLVIVETNIVRRLLLPHFSQPTSLEVYEDDDALHVVVLTWSGWTYWVTVKEDLQLCAKTQMPLLGNISAQLHPLSDEKTLLVAVDSSGNLAQQLFIQGKAVNTVHTTLSLGTGPYVLFGTGKMLFLHSENKICLLSPLKNSPFLGVSKITTTKWHILECHSAGKDRMIVLHPRGIVNVITYSKVPTNNNTYFSDKLMLKVLKQKDFIVAVQLKLEPNRIAGRMDRITTLSLFDRKTLTIRDNFVHEVASICWLGDNDAGLGPNHFVTAGRTDDPNKVLTIFEIRKGKIVRVSEPKMVGSHPKPFTVSCVRNIGKELHAVGNAYVVLTLEVEHGSFVWRSKVKGLNTPLGLFYGTDVCKVGNQIFVADAQRGVLAYNEDAKDVFELIRLPFSPCFVTAIAAWKNLLVYGDSAGNLGAFSVEGRYMGAKSMGLLSDSFAHEQVFGCNIGDAVNTICVRNGAVFVGTSGGGIFRIDDISVSDEFQSECELILQDGQVFDNALLAAEGILDGDLIKKMATAEAERILYQLLTE